MRYTLAGIAVCDLSVVCQFGVSVGPDGGPAWLPTHWLFKSGAILPLLRGASTMQISSCVPPKTVSWTVNSAGYDITVRASGYADWTKSGIPVPGGACDPAKAIQATARLQRAPCMPPMED